MSDKSQSLRRESIKLVGVVFMFLVTGPLLFLLLIPLSQVSRFVVRLIANIFRPDLACFFEGKGVVFSLDSVHKKPKCTVGLHFVMDGMISVAKLRHLFQQRILNDREENGKLRYPQLQQTWAQFLGFVFWKWDKEFDLSQHIRYYDYQDENLVIPKICTEEDLKRIGSHLISQPYVPGRSPWEILVVPKYRSKDNTTGKPQFVLVLRMHHALADGFSIMNLMLRFAGSENIKVPLPNFPKFSLPQKICRQILLFLRMPFDLVSIFLETFEGRNSCHLTDKKLSSTYLGFYSDRIPVEKIKEIKSKYRVGYNTVAYSIAIGAIRRLMLEAGQEMPKKTSFAIPMPLQFPAEKGLRNNAGMLYASCSPQACSPVEQLMELSQNLEKLVDAPTVAAVLGWAMDFILLLPIFVCKLAQDTFVVTFLMSSFAGPENEIEADFDGTKKAFDIIPFVGPVLGGKTGAVAFLLSMAGMQRIVLNVDKAIFAKNSVPDNFAQHVTDEIHALLNADESIIVN